MKKTNVKIVLLFFFILNQIVLPFNLVQSETNSTKKPKNVILIIGDGTGLSQVAITQYMVYGDKTMSFYTMPNVGLVTTHPLRDKITDSAAGATAMATGHKTFNGMVGMTPDSLPKETILESAKKLGMSTGLVATSHITDATPACFVAKAPKRSMHTVIAEQIAHSGVDVVLGGGIEYFLPKSDTISERNDNLDLTKTIKEHGYDFVTNKTELNKSVSKKLFGLFSVGGLKKAEGEPTLPEMTEKALQVLSKDNDGFFLMIEGSQVDWAAHGNDLEGVMYHVSELEKSLALCLAFAEKNPGTLIVVTADHETGGLTLTGREEGGKQTIQASWSTKGHSATPVPFYAKGPSSELFHGVIDNTDIAKLIAKALRLPMTF